MSSTSSTPVQPVLVGGKWRESAAQTTFNAHSPATGAPLGGSYPVSDWADVDAALKAAAAASREMRQLPGSQLAEFLNSYADGIEAAAEVICEAAASETALPSSPRLKDIELPRTTGQLRQAAAAAADGSWRMPVVDAQNNIRSVLEPVGPVLIFGPNNFPLAFHGISGGDFAAAIAAGNPVIAKAHPLHPRTSQLLAEAAHKAAANVLPSAAVQMLYAMDNDDGLRAAGDTRLGAVAFTGSRRAGLALKQAADAIGTPIFLELSSINPVVLLPGAVEERFDGVLDELATSGLMAAGQFCTNPGLVVMVAGDSTERFLEALAERYSEAAGGTLLGSGVLDSLSAATRKLIDGGAKLLAGGEVADASRCAFRNTLLRVQGEQFLAAAETFQTEAFGNCTLVAVVSDIAQAADVIGNLEGNLTGCIYSATDGADDPAYDQLAPVLGPKVGRLLNDKMPTGVAVSPAMNHGGPFPATGHPHFTAVGIPAALRRFTRLACYDNVRPHRLPAILRDAN